MGASLQKPGGSKRRSRAAFSEINVTPFVDVMLVLLIIFMITAPLITVGVPVNLPKTKAAQLNEQDEPLIVSIDAQDRLFLQKTEIKPEELGSKLLAVTNQNPDAKIHVRGDQQLSYGRVMEVMGIISQAGFHKVSLLAELPSSGSAAAPVHGHPHKPSSPEQSGQSSGQSSGARSRRH